MTTVSEPPYLHKSAGTKAQNGTTSHTITFSTDGDAPFTPATGSLLVVVVFGAVTHTVTGSWTEQLQPVNSAELSVFTSTNNSSTAPPSSITITHNGSNYPIAFSVKEYPAGSSYVSGTALPTSPGGANSTDTFPALTGLVGGAGNERVIEAYRGRSNTSTAANSASATWSAPWVEDCDLYQANVGGIEGYAFTGGHQINVTTTSVTPTATATYGVDAGFSPDREAVTFAINAAAASSTTPFTRDYSSTWRSFASFTRDYASTWRSFASFTTDYTSTYRVLNAWTRDYGSTYRVLNAFTRDYADTYRVLNAFVARDYSSTYRLVGAFVKDYASTWDVLSGTAFTRDYGSTWRVFNAFSADYDSLYRVLGTWARDYASTWRVLGAWTRDYAGTWRVFNGWTRDYASTYRVLASLSRDYSSTWAVLGQGPDGLVLQVWSGGALHEAQVSVWNGSAEIPAVVDSIIP